MTLFLILTHFNINSKRKNLKRESGREDCHNIITIRKKAVNRKNILIHSQLRYAVVSPFACVHINLRRFHCHSSVNGESQKLQMLFSPESATESHPPPGQRSSQSPLRSHGRMKKTRKGTVLSQSCVALEYYFSELINNIPGLFTYKKTISIVKTTNFCVDRLIKDLTVFICDTIKLTILMIHF